MPTTARIITSPYRPATCRVNTKGRSQTLRRFAFMTACIVIGGGAVSWLLINIIDAASYMLAGAR